MSQLRSKIVVLAKSQLAARAGYRISGIPSTKVIWDGQAGEPRLNLVVMGVRAGSVFGGTDTALRLFDALGASFPRIRIIVQGEDGSEFHPEAWPGWSLDDGAGSAPKTLGFQQRRGYVPRVQDSDVFIATHWMSTYLVRAALALQSSRPHARFIYLIQDYEPGFYPWSGRHLMAAATYQRKDDVIAIFNTRELADYFAMIRADFPVQYVFEPRLNPALERHLPRVVSHAKKKIMLVYGRPGTGRNAFDMIVESLLIWSDRFQGAKDWQIVSLGEKHRNVSLHHGLKIRSLGKQSMDAYAGFLLDASVGISLMASPHPSYPPLEMAEFGVRVVTNNYEPKDMAKRHPKIVSVAETTPGNFADALVQACNAYEAFPSPDPTGKGAFRGHADEFPFLKDLHARLMSVV
jgi:O-antigen biosynthesis protein